MALLALPWSASALAALGAGLPMLLLPLVLVLLRLGWRETALGPAAADAVRAMAAGTLGLGLGLGWAAVSMQTALDQRVAPLLRGHGQTFAACIEGVPERLAARGAGREGLRLRVRVIDELERNPERAARSGRAHQINRLALPAGTRLRLVWIDAPRVEPGSCLRFSARLQEPRGLVNPAGFDAERWLFASGIQGTGSVLRATPVEGVRGKAFSDLFGWADEARLAIAEFFGRHAPRHAAVLAAQVIGEVTQVPAEDWALFRATGTVHLMVISGLHITLAAGAGFLFGRFLGMLWPPVLLSLDAARLGALTGGVAAILYVALAGEGIAIARAALMVMPALILRALGWRTSLVASLRVAALVLLWFDPRSAHAPGFWLSVGAVMVLAMQSDRRERDPRRAATELRVSMLRSQLVTLLRIEWLMTIALAPLLLVLTGSWPLASLPSNLVAVPVMTVLVLPLALAAAALSHVLPALAVFALQAASAIFSGLREVLELLAKVPLLYGAPSPLLAALALTAGGLLLFSVGKRSACLLILAISAGLLPARVELPIGEFRVTALDVGQGDAILVDTARHRLLFDTGPGFPDGTDRVSSVIVPSIVATGPARLDAAIVSHADLDHAGGALSLNQALAPRRWFGAWPAAPLRLTRCHGRAWTWDGVAFRFLPVGRSVNTVPAEALPGGSRAGRSERAGVEQAAEPGSQAAKPGSNDDSCVLEIGNGRARVLLPGDISARVEMRLQREMTRPVSLIVAPHHGSRTSSSRAFVRLAGAPIAWFSAGFGNRYGHPHPDVIGRFQDIGARLHVTAWSGALSWSSRDPDRVGEERLEAPYWRAPVSPVGSVSSW